MVHGAMVDDLNQSVVFVCDGCVVDVDQAICASGEEDVVAGWVELKLVLSDYHSYRVTQGYVPRLHHHCGFRRTEDEAEPVI